MLTLKDVIGVWRNTYFVSLWPVGFGLIIIVVIRMFFPPIPKEQRGDKKSQKQE